MYGTALRDRAAEAGGGTLWGNPLFAMAMLAVAAYQYYRKKTDYPGVGGGRGDRVSEEELARFEAEYSRRGGVDGPDADSGAFYTLVPIRPRSRGERRSLRTFPGASLRPGSLAFNPDTPRRLSTPLLTPVNSTPTSLCMERPSEVSGHTEKTFRAAMARPGYHDFDAKTFREEMTRSGRWGGDEKKSE